MPTFGAITNGTRLYSNGTEGAKSSEAEEKTERADASKEISSEEIKETPSELLAKIKAKEAQVQDITVSAGPSDLSPVCRSPFYLWANNRFI